ncbi:hypothetical protein ACHAWT_006228 [Skeletonema menzelii]
MSENNNNPKEEQPSPFFIKFIDGFKKKTKEMEEETLKATEHVKSKFVDALFVDGSEQRSALKKMGGKKDTAAAAAGVVGSSDNSDEGALNAALGKPMSSDVTDASNIESDVVGGEANITIERVTTDKEEKSLASNNRHEPSSSSATTDTKSSSSMVFVELLVITIISISTVYHTWLHRLDIVGNQIPFIVAAHWALLTYFIGSSSTSEKCLVVSIDDNDGIAVYEEGASIRHLTIQEEEVTSFTKEQEQIAKSKTKQLIQRITLGRYHYSKIKRQYIRQDFPIAAFFTNLKPVGKSTTKNSPISWGMMNQLLKNPDFGRRKSLMGEIDMTQMRESCLQVQDELSDVDELLEEEGEEGNYEMGTAPLGNMRASKLEREFDYVVPMCKFRGMDFFVGDFPEKEIWKQPLLLKNGLRDKPTLIGNMMMPRGNLAAYLQMPDWFDDWDNIPEEKDDDPPDVKAFKRFFTGDEDYQRRRAKIIPMVVKAPYVVKIIAPDPSEMTMHTGRHPMSIKKVNKVVDPATGNTTAAAVMEFGVDFYTSAAIGRIINIVMPHLGSITVDLAIVIAPPWGAEGEEADEPSACLGVWRIDKVDFMSFAQLPEHPVEEVEEEIKDIMKSFAAESGN